MGGISNPPSSSGGGINPDPFEIATIGIQNLAFAVPFGATNRYPTGVMPVTRTGANVSYASGTGVFTIQPGLYILDVDGWLEITQPAAINITVTYTWTITGASNYIDTPGSGTSNDIWASTSTFYPFIAAAGTLPFAVYKRKYFLGCANVAGLSGNIGWAPNNDSVTFYLDKLHIYKVGNYP